MTGRAELFVLAVAVIAAAAAPASANGILDYSWTMADARVPMGDTAFNVWIQKKRDTILIEPSMKTVMGGGGHYPDNVWRTVAEGFVSPIGCGVSDVVPLSRAGAAWEATFVCPAGVDLHALARAQRDDLKRGLPLHR